MVWSFKNWSRRHEVWWSCTLDSTGTKTSSGGLWRTWLRIFRYQRSMKFLMRNYNFFRKTLPYQLGLPGDDDDDDRKCIMWQKMEFIMMYMIIRTIYSETQFSYESRCLSQWCVWLWGKQSELNCRQKHNFLFTTHFYTAAVRPIQHAGLQSLGAQRQKYELGDCFQLIPASKMCGVLLPRLLYALMVWCLSPGTTS